ARPGGAMRGDLLARTLARWTQGSTQVEEVLDVAGSCARHGRIHAAQQLEADLADGVAHARDRGLPGLVGPHPPPVSDGLAARLELWLHEDHGLPAGAEQPRDHGQDQADR